MKIELGQLAFIDPMLREIAMDTEAHFGVEFIVTSLYRIDDNGVHGTLPLRGLDWRCRDEELGSIVEWYINTKWSYDPDRPEKQCCMCHKVSGGALHLHLQTHAKTKRR